MRASANSMSRELAQLASYFQLVFLPDSSGAGGGGGGECTGLNNARTLLNKAQLAVKHKPNVPNLRESLLELSQFTPTTSISLHHHLHGEGALVPVSASAPASGTSTVVGTALMPTSTTAAVAITTTTTTSVTTVSATHSRSSGGLIRAGSELHFSSSLSSTSYSCTRYFCTCSFAPGICTPPPPSVAGAAFAIAIAAVDAAAAAASSFPSCSEVFLGGVEHQATKVVIGRQMWQLKKRRSATHLASPSFECHRQRSSPSPLLFCNRDFLDGGDSEQQALARRRLWTP
ncbi:hypothetical protein EmuJ_000951200 [Echinococcus multilocularis]|uniref:Uncharacterized protein n=1 Tax=Echinococcus multilocularis TaxID=6211 RepID=A0A068YAK0_ECHMU|nr:hypothetical protein EmuJ_000951200 [Echinococcus multilocularis]